MEQELGRPSNNIGNRYRKLVKAYTVDGDGTAPAPSSTPGVSNYLEVESERKLAAALAPVGAGAAGSGAGGDLPTEAEIREAAMAAAVLAGKKRGRPRTNPLPLMLDGKRNRAILASSSSLITFVTLLIYLCDFLFSC